MIKKILSLSLLTLTLSTIVMAEEYNGPNTTFKPQSPALKEMQASHPGNDYKVEHAMDVSEENDRQIASEKAAPESEYSPKPWYVTKPGKMAP